MEKTYDMGKKSTKRILLVDDEPDIREVLRFNLENEGYEIDEVSSAIEAYEVLDKHHLILLDVMMTGESGFHFADKLRKEGNNTPIIFLTAKDTENDMLTGFSIGADDYISKPFSIKEVMARVKSVLRRSEMSVKTSEKPERIVFDSFCLDPSTKVVMIDDSLISLTKTEYNILLLLVSHIGRIFSRSEILDIVWGDDEFVMERTVDVHITRLRKKIGKYGNWIINRTGYGYCFHPDTDK